MSSISNWDDEYARISRAASQLRTTNSFQNYQPHPSARQQQIRSVQSGLARLKASLENMRSSGEIGGGDYSRRMGLVDNLENQVGGSSGGGGSGGYSGEGDLLGMGRGGGGGGQQRLSTATQALRHQDQMIDELASGVSRLKDQTLMINDEANMQNRMLDDMEEDVETARLGLETETARALKLKEDQSVWRLYMIIAGLSILLFILIMTGL
mmetsp:Transcript_5707/g.7023  ORF Transcript_5707/g.7023 Transcript_5707/m.7023 type:complete len:211 (-) Transcript_5707:967-1599(-)